MTHIIGAGGFQTPLDRVSPRVMVRETARATQTLIERKITSMQLVGADVTAAEPMSGVVSVHLDGDLPGESIQVSSAQWEFFRVGQRVLILLAPPSYATLISPSGRPDTWIEYGVEPQPPLWTTDNQKAPTVSEIGNGSGVNAYFPAGASSYTLSAADLVTLPANKWVIVAVSMSGPPGATSASFSVSGISNSGAPLAWEQVAARSAEINGGVSSHIYHHVSFWRAYSTVAQSNVAMTASFDGDTTGTELCMFILSATNAKLLQTGAAVSNSTTTVDTTDDHSLVLGMRSAQVHPAVNLTMTAGASTTLIRAYTASLYRGEAVASRATTTPASTAVNITLGGSSPQSIGIAMELLGVPDSPVIGDGQAVGYYRLRGKSMDIRIAIKAGAATTFGTGQYRLQMPPGFAASPRPPGTIQTIEGILRPAGTNSYRIAAEIAAGATQFDKVVYADGGVQYWDSTHPAALTSGLVLGLNGVIEVA